MAREYDAIERSYRDLDPEAADAAERERTSGIRRDKAVKANRKERSKRLLTNKDFISWLSTEAERAGILSSTFHPHEGSQHFNDGFRGFALAMISDLEKLDPSVWVKITSERAKTIEEVNNAENQKSDDRDD